LPFPFKIECREISRKKKGDSMCKKIVLRLGMVSIPFFLVLAIGNAGAELKLGDEAPGFTLPSSQNRLVDYYKDYYGKHHLIITFFPAAFTPV
jgi:hypothetical protein